MSLHFARLRGACVAALFSFLFIASAEAQVVPCPSEGWQEGLVQYQRPNEPFPVQDTANVNATDCAFQQWSAEAFVWATALNAAGTPRFMTFQTPEDLVAATNPQAASAAGLRLNPATRIESAHAFVEADGNMLVGRNGYPIYASVHMNPTYFSTAVQNLVKTGAYCSQNPNAYFRLGAAVFKATWLRLDDGDAIPPGAFTTEALVPVLEQKNFDNAHYIIVPKPGAFVKARVALLGLHVVGYTENHPEFVWATFEHRGNSPRTLDNTFTPSATRSNPRNFTLYSAGTPFSQVNIPNPQSASSSVPQQVFNPSTQKFSQPTQVVLENKTGGANFPNGFQARSDIANVGSQLSAFFASQRAPQSAFATYDLIGTLWLAPNSYLKLDPNSKEAQQFLQTKGVGSINLANSTAETFVQNARNTDRSKVVSCFSCHNPFPPFFEQPNNLPSVTPNPTPEQKYCNGQPFPGRHISISHALQVGTDTAVPNAIGIPHAAGAAR